MCGIKNNIKNLYFLKLKGGFIISCNAAILSLFKKLFLFLLTSMTKTDPPLPTILEICNMVDSSGRLIHTTFEFLIIGRILNGILRI